jgi:hypothetical protein
MELFVSTWLLLINGTSAAEAARSRGGSRRRRGSQHEARGEGVAVVDVRGVEVEVARVVERVVLALAPAAPRRGAQRPPALPPEPSHQPPPPQMPHRCLAGGGGGGAPTLQRHAGAGTDGATALLRSAIVLLRMNSLSSGWGWQWSAVCARRPVRVTVFLCGRVDLYSRIHLPNQ